MRVKTIGKVHLRNLLENHLATLVAWAVMACGGGNTSSPAGSGGFDALAGAPSSVATTGGTTSNQQTTVSRALAGR